MKTQAKRGYRPAKPSRAGKPVKSGQSSLRTRPQRVSGPRKGQPAAPKARPGSLSKQKKTKSKHVSTKGINEKGTYPVVERSNPLFPFFWRSIQLLR